MHKFPRYKTESQFYIWGIFFFFFGPGGDNVLQLDIADLSGDCSVISLQMLEIWLCQWPSLAGMEHCAPHTRAVHRAMCFERVA